MINFLKMPTGVAKISISVNLLLKAFVGVQCTYISTMMIA